jgi:signal peptidase I
MIPDSYVRTIRHIWAEGHEETMHSVAGNCMAPIIREGDKITVEHGVDDISPGDVVVARISRTFIVHRVVLREAGDSGECFLLKGDQSSILHESISKNEIVGRVTEVSGSNGHFYLNSLFWKMLNYILSIRSSISVKSIKAGSPFWKAVNFLITCRSRIFNGRCSLSLIPFKGICYFYKIWYHMKILLYSQTRRRNI